MAETVQMELARILIRETEDTHYVELREVDPEPGEEPRAFPIVIGLAEAAAIERRLMGQPPLRPQTHELLADVIEQLGYRLEKIVINDLKDHTFFARLHLKAGENSTLKPVDIDSRPSDALALAAGSEIPIYVAEHVLEEITNAG
jgi:hypothetical protein